MRLNKWWIVCVQTAIILQQIIVILAVATVHSELAIRAHKIVMVLSAFATTALLIGTLVHVLVCLKRGQRGNT